jgi:hypothetical protein
MKESCLVDWLWSILFFKFLVEVAAYLILSQCIDFVLTVLWLLFGSSFVQLCRFSFCPFCMFIFVLVHYLSGELRYI